MNDEDYVIIWEAPPLQKPEFRLYYDEKGQVVCYTCDKIEGNYIVVDNLTFAEARPDVRVVDGKLIRNNSGSVVSRLYEDNNGILCEKEDISIITTGDGKYWNLKTTSL